ncbi:Putative lipooligosaccharide biosynthesis protein [Canicola haemoglobinophilus]|uniref:Lipooligosaccharide biosynthesis protein n=1 Tax=Canicola haemoglobinophilus TaxID=733 RepID=A0AB38H9E5_9PAST|nr:O-antigen ligase [Canicola haemoglobinophilus]STO54466.1 Putative lipooligosaccharide biosynthesis protein [Canicola haemoglobinophilus]STO69000.1 Putative lipooligosaccharide biosynthesis protein [Canicola haemoglobinophilus]
MQLIQQNKIYTYFNHIINVLVASFFLSVLTFKKGYSYAPIILGSFSFIYLLIYLFKKKGKFNLDSNDKPFIMAFLGYFMTFVLSAVIHDGGLKEIDNPSRILLFLTLIFLFQHFSLNIKLILHILPISSAFLGILAVYQKFYLNLSLPFPGHMHIQAGDIAVTIAAFSFAISIHFLSKKNYKLTALYLVCSFLGILASILTTARGGWVGLPFVLASIILFYRQSFNKKLLFLFLVILASAITIIGINSKTGVIKRYEDAKSDIVRYIDKKEKNSSLGARFDMWENAWLGIKEKPIFGWGNKGYRELKQSQQIAGTLAITTLKFNDAHNQYLDTAVKRGIIGLIGLLMVILIPFKYFLQNVKNEDEEIKCVAVLGCTLVISHLFFFLSQTFFGHTSGTTFYFFLSTLFYLMLKQLKVKSA